MTRTRDDLIDALLASLAAGVQLALAAVADRFPPELDFSLLFVAGPAVLASVAALALLFLGDRRPLQVACVYTWLMVLFTLPAYFLGAAWVPAALVLTGAVLRPRLSSGPSDAG